jgi:hypothetical protein
MPHNLSSFYSFNFDFQGFKRVNGHFFLSIISLLGLPVAGLLIYRGAYLFRCLRITLLNDVFHFGGVHLITEFFFSCSSMRPRMIAKLCLCLKMKMMSVLNDCQDEDAKLDDAKLCLCLKMKMMSVLNDCQDEDAKLCLCLYV